MRVSSAVPFLTPTEVGQLAASTGIGSSSTLVKRQAQQLGFLQALGSRIGFPQRTIATAQLLLLRFYLFFSPAEYAAHEVAIACTVVAGKINDTPKKPREVVLTSWALRFPELVRPVSHTAKAAASVGGPSATAALASQTQLGLGVISESDIDLAAVEKERKRVVAIESRILQSITFDFNVSVADNFRWTVKVARSWKVGEGLAKLAWQVAADCHRTYAPICYPPSTIACAALYCAALLQQHVDAQDEDAKDVLRRFRSSETASDLRGLLTGIEHVEEVTHALLDLYSQAAAALTTNQLSNSATPISPATPASPADPVGHEASSEAAAAAHRKLPAHVYSPPPFGILFWLQQKVSSMVPLVPSDIVADLTQIKIDVRQANEARQTADPVQRTEADLPPLMVSASLVRPFDKGGVLGDVEQLPMPLDALAEAWQQRDQDKQYAALQRFLF